MNRKKSTISIYFVSVEVLPIILFSSAWLKLYFVGTVTNFFLQLQKKAILYHLCIEPKKVEIINKKCVHVTRYSNQPPFWETQGTEVVETDHSDVDMRLMKFLAGRTHFPQKDSLRELFS